MPPSLPGAAAVSTNHVPSLCGPCLGDPTPAECRRVAQVLAAYRALPARARVDFCRQLMLDPGSEVPRFLAVAEELAGRCLEANRYLAAKLDGVTDLAEQIRQAIRGEAVEWSRLLPANLRSSAPSLANAAAYTGCEDPAPEFPPRAR